MKDEEKDFWETQPGHIIRYISFAPLYAIVYLIFLFLFHYGAKMLLTDEIYEVEDTGVALFAPIMGSIWLFSKNVVLILVSSFLSAKVLPKYHKVALTILGLIPLGWMLFIVAVYSFMPLDGTGWVIYSFSLSAIGCFLGIFWAVKLFGSNKI
jgi:hypothetical protein